MGNTHRLVWIEGQILAKCYPNATTIAEHFEISRRQAARDLEYMRDSLGAPLEYCHTRRGYYYWREGFALPGVYMTQEEREGLKRLSVAYEHLPEQHARNMAALFKRITAVPGKPRHAASPDDLPWLSRGPMATDVSIRFTAPGIVDFSSIENVQTEGDEYVIRALDFRQLLLFLLLCPCKYEILAPIWMKLRVGNVLKRATDNFSN